MTTLGAALLAGLATALLLRPPRSRARPPWALLRGPWSVGLVGAVVVGVVADGSTLALGLVGVGATTGGWVLLRRRRHNRAAAARAERLVEMCEALSAELRAGQPPEHALTHACEDWPELAPVVAAADIGADVPGALRRAAATPGLRGLEEVASAWQVSLTSGAVMSTAVAGVADSARRRQATARLVASELAAARATAVLLALLPVGVLGLGSGLGGDPVGFLLSTTVGLVSLAAGMGLGLLGLLWVEHIAARAAP